MVKNAGSKNKRGRLMKNMKSPNSGLMGKAVSVILSATVVRKLFDRKYFIDN